MRRRAVINRRLPLLRTLMMLAALTALASIPAQAHAQDDSFSLEESAASDDGAIDAPPRRTESASRESSSLASKFFVSRTTNADGEETIEILGSIIIWFLLLLSILSIGLIGQMTLTNQRKSIVPEGVINEVKALLQRGRYREVLDLTEREDSYFSRVLHAALAEANHGFSAMIRTLEQTSDEMTTIRLRRIEYLNVLGQVSPMIGLFGTVYGMILAFQAIVVTGGNADPVLLAGGIGTALTTTFWGLVVAIPALGGYAIIRNKIDELTTEGTLRAEELVNQFRPKSKQALGVMAGVAPQPGPEHAG